MEVAGLAIGIGSLVGLFSTCLEFVEKVDSYRDFGVDSRALFAKFEADKILFQKWGESVGVDRAKSKPDHGKISRGPQTLWSIWRDEGVSKHDHHRSLDDPKIFEAVRKILDSIKEITQSLEDDQTTFSSAPGAPGARPHGAGSSKSRIPYQKLQGTVSLKTKIGWALLDKARFLAMSQQFGDLVQRLYMLVPPDNPSQLNDRVQDSHLYRVAGLYHYVNIL